MAQYSKAAFRYLTDAELEERLTEATKKSSWREQLKIVAVNIFVGLLLGGGVAAAVAPAYILYSMGVAAFAGLIRACGVTEVADRHFDIDRNEEIEILQREKKCRERICAYALAAAALAAAPAAVAPPGAMTKDFNSDRISVFKPLTLKKPANTATLTMAG